MSSPDYPQNVDKIPSDFEQAQMKSPSEFSWECFESITTPKRRGLRRAPRRGCALRTLAPA